MIQKVNAPPLAFEKTVREVLTTPLAKYGFTFKEPFHLYVNEIVTFVRHRRGVREEIWVQRRTYYDDALTNADEPDEVDEPHETGQGIFWRSRHFFYIQLIVNNGCTDLFSSGKIAPSFTGEGAWRFTDEADLGRRLRDEALPYLLTGVMRHFDERLDNALDLIERGVETPYRPPDAA
jgi:hypothetical protein